MDTSTSQSLICVHNGHKKYKKPVVTTSKLNRQLVTLSNRFIPLASVQGTEVPNDTITGDKVEISKKRVNYNKKPSNVIRNKILILGDIHARNCSQVVKHNLNHNVEVQGIVKPRANIETIVNTSTKNVEKLTKKDTVVLWGSTRDVGKNE